MNNGFSQLVKSSSAAPGLLHRFVKTKLTSAGITGQTSEDLALAVYEVVANIVEHGYAGVLGEEAEISLKIMVERAGIEVLILDGGAAFAAEAEPPMIERLIAEGASGGLGLALIRSLVDELEFYRHDDTNVTRLFIRRGDLLR